MSFLSKTLEWSFPLESAVAKANAFLSVVKAFVLNHELSPYLPIKRPRQRKCFNLLVVKPDRLLVTFQAEIRTLLYAAPHVTQSWTSLDVLERCRRQVPPL